MTYENWINMNIAGNTVYL